MFRKILSNLPFHPSLLKDVSFYINRLSQETVIRRYGLVLVTIGFGLQIFVVAFPPSSSLATHRSDIIYGASSKQDVLNAYRRDQDQLGRKDIQAIFNHYGIGEAQIRNAENTTISDSKSDYINTARGAATDNRRFVPIDGVENGGLYEFPLRDWRNDAFGDKGYPALTGLSTYGFRFWIMLKGCGNIVIEKDAKQPNLEINKSLPNGKSYKTEDIVEYMIKFRNNGLYVAEDVEISDELPKDLVYKSHQSNLDLTFRQNGSNLKWRIDNSGSQLSAGDKWYYIKLQVEAKDEIRKACNQAKISSSNATTVITDKNNACIEVTKEIIQQPEENTDDDNTTEESPTGAVIALDKKVSNITQNIIDANNTTANPGDVLLYTVVVQNLGDEAAVNIELNGEYAEDVSDILEYADLTDLGEGVLNKSTGKISWGNVTILPGGKVENTFTAQVKNPVPNTPTSSSNPLSYDYILFNKYGRVVNVKLNKSAVKNIEQSVQKLPNTGSGEFVIVGALAVTFSGYFYFRNRLMVKELKLVRSEFSSGGV